MTGAIRDLEVESDESSSEDEEVANTTSTPKKTGGMFSIFKGVITEFSFLFMSF